MSLFRTLKTIAHREVLCQFRDWAGMLNPLFFFILVITFIPFGLPAQKENLQFVSVVSVWVAALLAILLSADHLLKADYQEGILEQWVISPYPLSLLLLTKIICHWALICCPILCALPLACLFLSLPTAALPILMVSFLLGTFALTLLNALIAALLLGLSRGGILTGVLALPFYIPVMILGSQSVYEVLSFHSPWGWVALLGAWAMMTLILAPFAVAYAVKLSFE